MSEVITPWLHILAVTVWVGPQFFLFIAAIPAMRTIEDAHVRARVMRTIVTRWGWLAWGALLVILLTGISNLFQTGEDAPFDLGDFDYRWANLFRDKMIVVGVIVALTAVHTFIIGPRQLKLAEQLDADPKEAARLRRLSIVISSLTLLGSIIAIFLGLALADHDYSFQKD